MSQAASQAAAFYRQALENHGVWTIRDEGGYPAPMTEEGRRSQPFWSSRSRVERIIKTVPAYSGFWPEEIALAEFLDDLLPALERDGFLVGLNWSGSRAVGYDSEPSAVAAALRAEAEHS